MRVGAVLLATPLFNFFPEISASSFPCATGTGFYQKKVATLDKGTWNILPQVPASVPPAIFLFYAVPFYFFENKGIRRYIMEDIVRYFLF